MTQIPFPPKKSGDPLTTFENELVTIWKDDNGIIHTNYKPNAQLSGPKAEAAFRFRTTLHPDFRTGHFLDMSELTLIDFKARQQAAQTYSSKHYKAVVVFVSTPVSEMIAKMMMSFHPHEAIEIRLFTENKEAAYQWLLETCFNT